MSPIILGQLTKFGYNTVNQFKNISVIVNSVIVSLTVNLLMEPQAYLLVPRPLGFYICYNLDLWAQGERLRTTLQLFNSMKCFSEFQLSM